MTTHSVFRYTKIIALKRMFVNENVSLITDKGTLKSCSYCFFFIIDINQPYQFQLNTFPCSVRTLSERLYHQHGKILSYRADPEDTGALRDILKQARDRREDEARPAVFKVRVQNPRPRKPSIK